MNRKEYGNIGEKMAVKYLKKKGYKILEKNYLLPFGEIDIIARLKDIIVFVEVKRRLEAEGISPSQNVGDKKQRRIVMVAKAYLQSKELDAFTRFDVIEIVGEKIEHIEGAFYAK